jgi:hypothetical protein
MNLRTLTISVAALVGLCAVVWFLQRPAPRAAADPRIGQPVLAPDLAAQAARVKISDQSKTVELARQADGSWTVASYHDFPADFTKLSRLIGDLTTAKISRLVTARADRLSRLEFKDTALALQDAAGKQLWQITLGKPAEGGGRYLRYGTEEKGYLADLSLWLDSDSKGWADSTLLNLKADDIARIEIGFTDTTQPPVIISRAKKEDAWTPVEPATAPAGKHLKTSVITALLSNLSGLRFTDTLAPDDEKAVAARAHSRTLKLTTFDQKTYTLSFARKPEEKKPKPAPASENKPADGVATVAAAEAGKPAESTPLPTEPAVEKPKEPEFETIPAGPVFVQITSSDTTARLNSLMQKRAFQIGEWTYTSLPGAPNELWEDTPAEPKKEEPKASDQVSLQKAAQQATGSEPKP